jgi:hypothetical protein
LLPYLSGVRPGDRAREFRSRCGQCGIAGDAQLPLRLPLNAMFTEFSLRVQLRTARDKRNGLRRYRRVRPKKS